MCKDCVPLLTFYKLQNYSYTVGLVQNETDASCNKVTTIDGHVSSLAHQALEKRRIRSQERPIVQARSAVEDVVVALHDEVI